MELIILRDGGSIQLQFNWCTLQAVQSISGLTSREQTFNPRPKWALVPAFFAPGTRDTFSPGWWLQPGLKVPPNGYCARQRWQGPLVPVGATNRD